MPVACEPLACEAVRWRSSVGWEGGGRIRVCGAGTRGAVRLGASLGAAAAPMRPVPDVDEEEGAAAAPAVERGLGRPDGEEGGGGERLCERERRSERAADAEQERVAQEAKGAHRVDEAVVHKDERVDGLQRACSQPGSQESPLVRGERGSSSRQRAEQRPQRRVEHGAPALARWVWTAGSPRGRRRRVERRARLAVASEGGDERVVQRRHEARRYSSSGEPEGE